MCAPIPVFHDVGSAQSLCHHAEQLSVSIPSYVLIDYISSHVARRANIKIRLNLEAGVAHI